MRFLYMDDRSGSAFTWLGRRELVGRKGDQHDELVAARDQMERLVRAIVEIGSDLDLDVTIHRIVNAAIELAGARYGALGIRGSDGTLVSFVHAGTGWAIPDTTHSRRSSTGMCNPNGKRRMRAVATVVLPEPGAPILVQGMTWICSAGPVHCTMVTAIAWAGPEEIAAATRGLRKAAA